MDDAFDRVWASYPRREAKKDARKAWGQVNADQHVDEILAALDWQKRTDSWRRGYVPYLSTYLRGERWTDENPAMVRGEDDAAYRAMRRRVEAEQEALEAQREVERARFRKGVA